MKSLEEIRLENVRATATIGGTVTNRVKVKTTISEKRRRVRTQGEAPRPKRKTELRPRRPPGEGGYKSVCVTFPPVMLARIDEWARKCQMNRSRFLLAAACHFSAKVFP